MRQNLNTTDSDSRHDTAAIDAAFDALAKECDRIEYNTRTFFEESRYDANVNLDELARAAAAYTASRGLIRELGRLERRFTRAERAKVRAETD